MAGNSPSSAPVNPLTGAGADSGIFGGLGPIGLQPMQGAGGPLPTQQQYQQQGGGIQFPAGNFTGRTPQGPSPFDQMQGGAPNVGPNNGLAMSHGVTWNGNPVNNAGGANNYLFPTNWEQKSNPGPVDQAGLDQVSKLLGGMRQNYGDVRQQVGAGTKDPRAMTLMNNRMNNLRDYAQFMRGNAAEGTTIKGPGTGRGGGRGGGGGGNDPFAPGVATDFTGGLSNSAQLMKLLAQQGQGAL